VTVEEEVAEANLAFSDAFEARDLAAMGDVWERSSRVAVTHPGWPTLRGFEKVLSSWRAIFANTPYIQFFLTDVKVTVDGDVAYVTCTENVLSSGEGAPEEGFVGGKAVATNVFRRTSTGWRLWIHHASPVLSSGGRQEEAE
jgi:ketosteroid isomerase-like protein